jgi:integrase
MKRRGALKDAPPRERYLSHEEEAAILRLARAKFDAARLGVVAAGGTLNARALTSLMILAAIAVAIDTGLRDEEQLRLRWPQIDLERDQVFIPGDKAKNGRDRWVPLLPRTKAILSALPRNETVDSVFWHRNGAGFYDLNHTLQGLAAQVGIVDEQAERARVKKRVAKGRTASKDKRLQRAATGIRWHDLRKTCGCRLSQDHKMPLEQVSLWLGHSSVVQTQRAYAFLKAEQLHESVGTSRTNLGTVNAKVELKTAALIGKLTSRAQES